MRPIAALSSAGLLLVDRLTGRAVWITPWPPPPWSMISTGRLDPELAGPFEIEPGECRASRQRGAGRRLSAAGAALTGLRPGIPVAVGTGDDFSTPLGAGSAPPGRIAVSFGTGEVVGAVHGTAGHRRRPLVETHAYPGGASSSRIPAGFRAARSAGSWSPHLGFAAMDALAGQARRAPMGVTFLPASTGAMAPEWVAEARGCFYGLTAAHGRGHLTRAVLEGCAFAMRDVVDRLAASASIRGALAAERWRPQPRLGRDPGRAARPGRGGRRRLRQLAFGAALLAAVAAGPSPASAGPPTCWRRRLSKSPAPAHRRL